MATETRFTKGMLVWCTDPGDDFWLNLRTPHSPLVVVNVESVGTPDERHTHLWVNHKSETRGGYESTKFRPSEVPLVIGRWYLVDGAPRALTGFRVAHDDSCTAVLDGGEERALLDLTQVPT